MATEQWVVEPNDLPQRSRTITRRTDDAIKQIVARIDAFAKKYPDQQVDELIFDDFGFSRGLACARHFVNRLAKGKVKDLQNAINDKLKGAAKLKLRFLGICDTVAAILPGLFEVANGAHNGDTGKEVDITTDFTLSKKSLISRR